MTYSGASLGSGPIFLDRVACSGGEATLLECQTYDHLGLIHCDHSQDAGIQCGGTVTRKHTNTHDQARSQDSVTWQLAVGALHPYRGCEAADSLCAVRLLAVRKCSQRNKHSLYSPYIFLAKQNWATAVSSFLGLV